MKKIKVLFIICLIFLSVHVGVNAAEYKDVLRVGLSYGNSAKAQANFSSSADINVYDVNTEEYITTIAANTKVTLNATDAVVQCGYYESSTNVVRLESNGTIFYNGKEYRGSFEVRNNGDLLRVINIVNMDDYLASLLGKEMSPSWPIEALKAQAVCARNFAVASSGKHASYGFDVCATQDCQVYGGVSSEAESTRRAVKETKGVTVTYEGKVVQLYYFSCDGGYTENSEDVWVSALGYLRGKKDIYENPEYATLYNWKKTFTKKQIEDILAKKGKSVGELLNVVIEEKSENNGVLKLTFIGTDGKTSITKSTVRSYFSLNSNTFTIERHINEQTEEPSNASWITVLTGSGIQQIEKPTYVLSADGLCEITYDEEEEEEENGISYDSYTFNGHGYGHLVGMSQWGAYSMAKEGFNYKDILNFYFTDIEIVENAVTEEEKTEAETMTYEPQTNEAVTEIETEENEISDNIQWSDTGL
ncbi:MAG: SpoIID/LytB domain-containing protein [Clostridia bacterium]|nr:SpoIID/LytB domain-containing protein [Clostridia bacterium]